MSLYQQIVLIGPMGAGKSTVGRLLAHALSLPFKDSDHIIEAKTGADIRWIFDVEGEEGFRNRESAILEELMTRTPLVLATGGGIVLRESNRDLLQCADAIIYLTTELEYLIQRTLKDKKRPLLQVDNPEAKILALMHQRDPIYRSVATHVVVTDKRSPKWVVRDILSILQPGK